MQGTRGEPRSGPAKILVGFVPTGSGVSEFFVVRAFPPSLTRKFSRAVFRGRETSPFCVVVFVVVFFSSLLHLHPLPPSVSVSLSSPPFAIPGFFVSVCLRCFGGLTTPRSSASSFFCFFCPLATIDFLSKREKKKRKSNLKKPPNKETKTSKKTSTTR